VYAKGFPLKDKIPLYLIAAVFLVLLYGTPSGLVLYWMMNNIFSLVKNCLQKTKKFSQFPNNILLPNGDCVQTYNPLLLVKDFYAEGPLLTDNAFMTNADVPLLALKDIIDKPKNPFTGIPLQSVKEQGVTITTASRLFNPAHHPKYRFDIKKDEWLFVHDNIFESANWQHAEH